MTILIIILMLALNAVLAGYEIALASISRTKLAILLQENLSGAKAALFMKDHLEGSLAALVWQMVQPASPGTARGPGQPAL